MRIEREARGGGNDSASTAATAWRPCLDGAVVEEERALTRLRIADWKEAKGSEEEEEEEEEGGERLTSSIAVESVVSGTFSRKGERERHETGAE